MLSSKKVDVNFSHHALLDESRYDELVAKLDDSHLCCPCCGSSAHRMHSF